jgi:hypothetical protein
LPLWWRKVALLLCLVYIAGMAYLCLVYTRKFDQSSKQKLRKNKQGRRSVEEAQTSAVNVTRVDETHVMLEMNVTQAVDLGYLGNDTDTSSGDQTYRVVEEYDPDAEDIVSNGEDQLMWATQTFSGLMLDIAVNQPLMITLHTAITVYFVSASETISEIVDVVAG